MKVGSFSPPIQNLNAFESKTTLAPRTETAAAPRPNLLPSDGFDAGGAPRPILRPQGDGFESPKQLKAGALLKMSGKTPLSQLTSMFKAGRFQKPSSLPTNLEPLQGALDKITQDGINNTGLTNLGKIRRNVLESLKELGLKGKDLKDAAKQLVYAIVGGKAGGIGTQWLPGD